MWYRLMIRVRNCHKRTSYNGIRWNNIWRGEQSRAKNLQEKFETAITRCKPSGGSVDCWFESISVIILMYLHKNHNAVRKNSWKIELYVAAGRKEHSLVTNKLELCDSCSRLTEWASFAILNDRRFSLIQWLDAGCFLWSLRNFSFLITTASGHLIFGEF